MAQDPFGYSAAMSRLRAADGCIAQPTPCAVRPTTTPARTKRPRPSSPDDGSPGCLCGLVRNPRKRARARRIANDDDSSDKDAGAEVAVDAEIFVERKWEEKQQKETDSPFPVAPNYPDAKGVLPPGSRRKAVNVIYLMAHVLNLEICTPSIAVLVMDRFFSACDELPSSQNAVMLMAMVCLNIAGKVADLDRGYCGSRGVMALMRAACPANIRQISHANFARYVSGIERAILETIDSTLLSYECALQTVAEITGWCCRDERMWMRAAFLCDVFAADTASTAFSQTQIARAAMEISSLTRGTERCDAFEHVVRALMVFFGSAAVGDDHARDPYYGVRARHSANDQVRALRAKFLSTP